MSDIAKEADTQVIDFPITIDTIDLPKSVEPAIVASPKGNFVATLDNGGVKVWRLSDKKLVYQAVSDKEKLEETVDNVHQERLSEEEKLPLAVSDKYLAVGYGNYQSL